MNCFKTKRRPITHIKRNQKIRNNELNAIFKKFGKAPIQSAYDHQKLGELILEKVIDSRNTLPFQRSSSVEDNLSNEQKNNSFILEILKTKQIEVNNIKNFVNQTLLHFASENNNNKLCQYLLQYGADCLIEDNYRQTPFIIAAKLNNLELVDIFMTIVKRNKEKANEISGKNLEKQIRNASYHACNFGNLSIVKYLFEKFDLKSEYLLENQSEAEKSAACHDKNFELNVLHIACYKANANIVEFLLANALNKKSFINRPINDFRCSTALEEALKGFLSYSEKPNTAKDRIQLAAFNKERNLKINEFLNIFNILIENDAKFSKNFIQNNGLSKLVSQTFAGPNKDLDFLHFLCCFSHLFRYKLTEIFYYEEKKNASTKRASFINCDRIVENDITIDEDLKDCDYYEKKLEICCKLFDLEKTLDEFLLKTYLISQKVIKDHKRACLNKYIELLFILHFSGQLKIKISKLSYLKENNLEIYEIIEDCLKKPLSLKWLSTISIRGAIKNLCTKKIKSLQIPDDLKKDLFLESIPIIDIIKNNFCTYLF